MRFEMALHKELEMAKSKRWPLIIPMGPLEYHGAHCVYGTDVLIPMGILERYEKLSNGEVVIMPPFWYGPASYAVAPSAQASSIQVDYDALEKIFHGIFMSLLKNGWRNIFVMMAHQTESLLPMQLSVLKAAKAVTFEFLQERDGEGWWGKGENADFYESMNSIDHPWNWIRTFTPLEGLDRSSLDVSGDHAGKWETSTLMALNPDLVKLERVFDTNEWFCQAGAEATKEIGEKKIAVVLENMKRIIK